MTPFLILVVDDEADVESLFTQKFRREIRKGKYSFLFAQDGMNALEVLAENPDVGIVFSDINMPRMDGLTFLEKMMEDEHSPTAIIVSAYGDQTNIRTAMNRGAFDFITKPIDLDDLTATLEKALRYNQQISQLKDEREAALQTESQLRKYFSPAVAKVVAADSNAISAEGGRKTATFLFTDLNGFLPFVEESPPHVVVDTLNEYLDEMTRIVFQHDGTLMKIVGDSLSVVFGAPEHDPDHASKAVQCALELEAFASHFQDEKNAKGVPIGLTRIGINTGDAIIGNFGGKNFFEYTAYGAAVNIASRLENANKALGTRMCISQSTVDNIDGFLGRPAGRLLVKGSQKPILTFEPVSQEQSEAPSHQAYLDAFKLLENGDPAAKAAFAALVGQDTEDPLSAFHLSRVLTGEVSDIVDL